MTIASVGSQAFDFIDTRNPVATGLAQGSLNRSSDTPAKRPLAAAALENLDYHLHHVLIEHEQATSGADQGGSTDPVSATPPIATPDSTTEADTTQANVIASGALPVNALPVTSLPNSTRPIVSTAESNLNYHLHSVAREHREARQDPITA